MRQENLTIAWITRKNVDEDNWTKQYLQKFKNYEFKKIVVGYSSVEEDYKNFSYIPFWENGLDEKGLLCHKKNLAVKNCKTENLIVLHADCCPDDNFFSELQNIVFEKNMVYAPVGFIEATNKRGFTWCTDGLVDRNKPVDEPADSRTYISGAAIMGLTHIFLENPWNENLRHNQGEDVELYKRMANNNIKSSCISELIIKMKNDR